MNTVKTNFAGFKRFRAQIAELETMRAQVGLFQDTAGRSADKGRIVDNPSLGATHEFGSGNIPERSWLRMPLTLHLGPVMQGIDWFDSLSRRGVKRTLAFLGVLGEEVVQESFATRGWGAWKELAKETIRKKGSSAILIETAQMRKAISSRVV